MDFREVVRRRRMCHTFEQRPVDRAVIDDLLDIARRGPSAGFSQGTDFVVLDTPETVARYWALTGDEPANVALGPPVLVLALSDPERYLDRYRQPDKIAYGLGEADAWPVRFWDTDTAMACMLLLLAAVDSGLGGWLFGVAHGEDALRAELAIPADRPIISVIGLGHPTVDPNPRGSGLTRPRRQLADMIHWNGW